MDASLNYPRKINRLDNAEGLNESRRGYKLYSG